MYFDSCKTLDELKSAYRKLALKYHPDAGGDAATMKAINAEHDDVFNLLKLKQNAQAANDDTVHVTTETPEEFRTIVDILMSMEGVEVELCGSWLWICGDTFAHKDALKAAGCRWSKSKGKWYWHHPEDGQTWSRGRSSMNAIRERYGSAYLKSADERKKIASA